MDHVTPSYLSIMKSAPGGIMLKIRMTVKYAVTPSDICDVVMQNMLRALRVWTTLDRFLSLGRKKHISIFYFDYKSRYNRIKTKRLEYFTLHVMCTECMKLYSFLMIYQHILYD